MPIDGGWKGGLRDAWVRAHEILHDTVNMTETNMSPGLIVCAHMLDTGYRHGNTALRHVWIGGDEEWRQGIRAVMSALGGRQDGKCCVLALGNMVHDSEVGQV